MPSTMPICVRLAIIWVSTREELAIIKFLTTSLYTNCIETTTTGRITIERIVSVMPLQDFDLKSD